MSYQPSIVSFGGSSFQSISEGPSFAGTSSVVTSTYDSNPFNLFLSIYGQLLEKDGFPHLTENQMLMLSSLTQNNVPLISRSSRAGIIEVIQTIKDFGKDRIDEAIQTLSLACSSDQHYCWQLPAGKEAENAHMLEVVIAMKKAQGFVSGQKCSNCGHDRVVSTERQIRKADEPPTQIYECVSCKHKWIVQ